MENVVTGWKRYVLVQPPLMLLFFAQFIAGNILTDLIMYRTCVITVGINETECSLLHENSSSAEALKINTQIQPQTSLIIMTRSFVENILPALLSLFIGPWSDKYGRKPLLLSGYIGVSLTFIILSLMANWNISPWFLLIAYVPPALSGGYCVLILASICYIADITNERDRAWQLAWMEALISLGILMGLFTGPLIFRECGYSAVFGIAAVLSAFAGLYIYFGVSETIRYTNSRNLDSLFDVMLVKDLLNTCTKKRHGFNRCIVWCCMACLVLLIATYQDMTVGLLFTSARLGWDVGTYSVYTAFSITVSIFGTMLGLRVLKTYGGLSEGVTSMLAVLSSLSGALTRAFTWKSWHMYLSAVMAMFGGIASPTIRALLSKSVPSEDAGKVFSLTVSLESLIPFAAASLYDMIYSYYMPPLYPSPYCFVSVVIFIVTLLLLITIQVQVSRQTTGSCTPLVQEDE